MSDKPILFSGPMVRALLSGTKTQTRRVFNGVEEVRPGYFHVFGSGGGIFCDGEDEVKSWAPSYLRVNVGDRLWVRESLKIESTDQGVRYPTYAADGAKLWPLSEWKGDRNAVPSIHMWRWASRLTLTVTDVRVERLHHISTQDIYAEGAITEEWLEWREDAGNIGMPSGSRIENERDVWEKLWTSINGFESWEANPWVAAYGFTVQRANIDSLPKP